MCNGLWVLKMHRSSSVFLTQYWCALNCSTDVLRELDWWSGSRQHLDFCQFGYQVSLVRRGIWLLACSESAGFFFLRFKQKVKWKNINATFRLSAYKCLLGMWTPLTTAFENIFADKKTTAPVRTKSQRILK